MYVLFSVHYMFGHLSIILSLLPVPLSCIPLCMYTSHNKIVLLFIFIVLGIFLFFFVFLGGGAINHCGFKFPSSVQYTCVYVCVYLMYCKYHMLYFILGKCSYYYKNKSHKSTNHVFTVRSVVCSVL